MASVWKTHLNSWTIEVAGKLFSLADEEALRDLMEEAMEAVKEGRIPELREIPILLSEKVEDALFREAETVKAAYEKRIKEKKKQLLAQGEDLDYMDYDWNRPTFDEEFAMEFLDNPPENLYILVPREEFEAIRPHLSEVGKVVGTVNTVLGERCLLCGGILDPSAAWANLPGAPGLGPRPALGHRKGCPAEDN